MKDLILTKMMAGNADFAIMCFLTEQSRAHQPNTPIRLYYDPTSRIFTLRSRNHTDILLYEEMGNIEEQVIPLKEFLDKYAQDYEGYMRIGSWQGYKHKHKSIRTTLELWSQRFISENFQDLKDIILRKVKETKTI